MKGDSRLFNIPCNSPVLGLKRLKSSSHFEVSAKSIRSYFLNSSRIPKILCYTASTIKCQTWIVIWAKKRLHTKKKEMKINHKNHKLFNLKLMEVHWRERRREGERVRERERMTSNLIGTIPSKKRQHFLLLSTRTTFD